MKSSICNKTMKNKILFLDSAKIPKCKTKRANERVACLFRSLDKWSGFGVNLILSLNKLTFSLVFSVAFY